MKTFRGFELRGDDEMGYVAENEEYLLFAPTLEFIRFRINDFLNNGELLDGYKKLKKWRVWGADLPEIIISADSFDEALAHARLINKKYCAAQLND